MRRATHQIVDQPHVFHDPLALTILGEVAAGELRSDPSRFETSARLRAFVAARSRYAEDELAAAFERGVRQYVLLGAGLDTFAYRNTHANTGLRVFEVDHPATQAWKREQIQAAGIPIPDSLTFVPVDFEKRTLAETLLQSSLSTDEPAFFSWLGVVPYLTAEAARTTLAFIGSLPPNSGVVFDYAVPADSLGPRARAAFDELAGRVARAGEPFQLFFDPADLETMLGSLGFQHIEDLNGAEIDRRYFSDRTDTLSASGGLGRLVSARV
jgi:methyltransferase (TIGR00027 family)